VKTFLEIVGWMIAIGFILRLAGAFAMSGEVRKRSARPHSMSESGGPSRP